MIRKYLLFCIQGHFFLSISAFIFSLGILDGNKKALQFSAALSLAIIGVYNLNRLNKLKSKQLPNEFISWYQQRSIFLWLIANVCLFSAAWIYTYLIGLKPVLLLLIMIIGLITFFYVFTINKMNLRQIPGTKAIWISIVWTFIGIVIPKLTLNLFHWIDLHYFILFLALTIPGDLRDSKLDSHKMRTIPQIMGKRKATMLFYFLITSFLSINFLFDRIDILGFSAVLIYLFILISKNIIFRYELMDGVLLILGISYLLS